MNEVNYKPYADLLQTAGTITAADVLKFRRDVFNDGIVNQAEADALFAFNDATDTVCDEWNEFFIEAMTCFVVEQAEPRGYVSVENANWLMHSISKDGVVKSSTELELLVKTLAKATSSPQTLIQFAMLQVSLAVVEGQGVLRNRTQKPGVISEEEVELLRTILYASGGDNNMSISKQEAEVLVQLNDQTNGAENHSSWQQLFVRATANYLMAASGATPPSRLEALAREEWLNEDEADTAGFMGEMLSGFGKMFSADFFDDIFTSSHRQMENAWKKRNVAFEQATQSAERIDLAEAKWLVEHINRDGEINDNEKALLQFIKKESPSIDPVLAEMINKVA